MKSPTVERYRKKIEEVQRLIPETFQHVGILHVGEGKLAKKILGSGYPERENQMHVIFWKLREERVSKRTNQWCQTLLIGQEG